MTTKRKGMVEARVKRPLASAAVAGLAGLSMHGAAYAADDAMATAAADADQPTTVSGVDVEGRRRIDNVKSTAEPLDTPQTVTVIPRGVIAAQNLLSLRDVLSTVPGITFGAGEGGGGFGDSITLRGYAASNDVTVDGVRDSAQYSRSDPFNLEQIEVTNGANSVYSGAGSVGGTINLVNKRPGRGDSATVTAGVGADNYYRGAVDANHRLNGSVSVRLNAMVHRNDAPGRRVEAFERWGIAPAITVGMHSPTKFTAMYFHQQDTNTPQYGVPYYNGGPVPGIDPSTYYGYANLDVQEQNIDMLTGILDHEFGGELEGLQVRSLTRYQVVDQYILVDPPQAAAGGICLASNTAPVSTATNITGYAPCLAGLQPGFYRPSGPRGNYRDTRNTILHNQTDLTWTGEIGGMKHEAVFGFSVMSETYRLDNGATLRTAVGTTAPLPDMNIANPNNIWAGPFNVIQGGGALTAATATPPNSSPSGGQDGDRNNQAVYFFDNASLNDQWSVNLGVRYEHNEGRNSQRYYTAANFLPNPFGGQAPGPAQPGAQGGRFSGNGEVFRSSDNLFSYRLGVVYKPLPEASLYVAYGNSKTPSQATVNGSGACTAVTCTVDPETAESIEIGGKWDYRGRLSLTAALFENKRGNYRVASNDPLVVPQQLDGAARVRGFTLGASGLITDEWAIFANYTYLQSKVLQGVNDADKAAGLDFTAGDPLVQVPDHAFSLFTTYDLPMDIQVGYGVTYQGESYLTQHTGTRTVRSTIPLIKSDSYVVHRLTVAWTPTDRIELRANVNNVLDKEYYTRIRNNGWATPGDRRNATLTLSYRF